MSATTKKTAKEAAPKNPLFPIFEPGKFVGKDGQIMKPLYFTGEPRDYRLDMGLGALCIGENREKVGTGKSFKVIPIAVRCLEGKLFVKKEKLETEPIKKWFEVYFINEAGHLGIFMFHGFSVQNLAVKTKELKYLGAKLTECVWTINLMPKTNKNRDSYHMAFFNIAPLAEEDKAIVKAVYNNVIDAHYHIYRHETRDYTTTYFENWSDGKTPTAKELANREAKQKELLADFSTKEELALQNKEAIKEGAKPAAA